MQQVEGTIEIGTGAGTVWTLSFLLLATTEPVPMPPEGNIYKPRSVSPG
jgi:hypothetical protein